MVAPVARPIRNGTLVLDSAHIAPAALSVRSDKYVGTMNNYGENECKHHPFAYGVSSIDLACRPDRTHHHQPGTQCFTFFLQGHHSHCSNVVPS